VAALAISQTVGYGALYYAFAVLLVPMAADLEASTTAGLLLAAGVDDLLSLYAVRIGIGLVSGAVRYEAAFAVVVSWFPDARPRGTALLAVTVVAGFASSIFFPLTGLLVDAYGWRTALVVLAGVHA
jgi:MFS family permease